MHTEDAARLQVVCGLSESERSHRLSDIETGGREATGNMVEFVREFVRNPRKIVTVYGTSGNAKTVALQAAVNELVERGVEAVYVTAFDLIGYVRAAFDGANRNVVNASAHERLKRFEQVPVLAIDELDKVKMTSWVEEQITDLIDHRYRAGLDGERGTLIAMNGHPETLSSWIYSRLADGRNEMIENNDSDLRPVMRQGTMIHPDTGERLE